MSVVVWICVLRLCLSTCTNVPQSMRTPTADEREEEDLG
jgi:starvation-inducible outer membrane lipoprotein